MNISAKLLLATTLTTLNFVLQTSNFFAQDGTVNWTVKNPFTHKVFIENKGQFDAIKQNNTPVMFAYTGAVNVFFTSNGLMYNHNQLVPMTEEEMEKAGRKEEDEEGEKDRVAKKIVPNYVNMNWVGTNPDAVLLSESPVSYYFTYGDQRDSTGRTSIKAQAYNKVIYKDLYPNIDIEYTFPENSARINCAIILHNGADLSAIRMNYSQRSPSGKEKTKPTIDGRGNVQIETPIGNFIDTVPLVYDEHGTLLKTAFAVKGNTVALSLITDNK